MWIVTSCVTCPLKLKSTQKIEVYPKKADQSPIKSNVVFINY